MKNANALKKAIETAGGQAALAELINQIPPPNKKTWVPKRQSHVSSWLIRDKGKVPPVEARMIDEALDGEVSRFDLRPDVFGKQPNS